MNLRRFPYPRIKKLPATSRKIARLFRRKRIRLIHARFGNAGVRMLSVKRRLRIPLLTSFHGFDLPAKRKRRKSYHRKLPVLFRVGDKFTVPSRHMKRKLIRWGCPRHKIKIMYSGIDVSKFQYTLREPKRDHIVIIGVGRLHPKKGFHILLKAFRKVHKMHPSTRLIIVGDGSERRRLKRMISKYRLKRSVHLKGHVSHRRLARMLAKADIFCLPSLTTRDGNQEGIPNSIKEALATGMPVISTRHGGIPELVGHGKEGFLVPERNVKQLAKRLMQLINQPELRQDMGRSGRAKVERYFNSAKQVKRLEGIYRRLIRKRR